MFLHLSVILFRGGVSQHAMGQTHPPGQTPPPILRDTVNKRAVRILLECILVSLMFSLWCRFLLVWKDPEYSWTWDRWPLLWGKYWVSIYPVYLVPFYPLYLPLYLDNISLLVANFFKNGGSFKGSYSAAFYTLWSCLGSLDRNRNSRQPPSWIQDWMKLLPMISYKSS